MFEFKNLKLSQIRKWNTGQKAFARVIFWLIIGTFCFLFKETRMLTWFCIGYVAANLDHLKFFK